MESETLRDYEPQDLSRSVTDAPRYCQALKRLHNLFQPLFPATRSNELSCGGSWVQLIACRSIIDALHTRSHWWAPAWLRAPVAPTGRASPAPGLGAPRHFCLKLADAFPGG
jgi:hypothetical protein